MNSAERHFRKTISVQVTQRCDFSAQVGNFLRPDRIGRLEAEYLVAFEPSTADPGSALALTSGCSRTDDPIQHPIAIHISDARHAMAHQLVVIGSHKASGHSGRWCGGTVLRGVWQRDNGPVATAQDECEKSQACSGTGHDRFRG